MGKRFTDSEKYRDKWYRRLPLSLKVGWDYLYHTCDCAGVIDIDEDLARFEIGEAVDWQALQKSAAHRVMVLGNGKWWLTGFIAFQYGELSEECKAHKPIFKSLEKNKIDLSAKGYPKGIDTLKDKEKEKDKEKDKGGVGENELDRIANAEVREAADEWLRYKRERREAYKPTGLRGFVSRLLTLEGEHGGPAVCAAIQRGMANNWAGFEHDIGQSRGSPSMPTKPRPMSTAQLMGDAP